MHATVIDTLRYAVRLKEAGVEPAHAEAMSRALNDELTEGLATKADVDSAVTGLNARFDALEAKVDSMEAKFDGKFGSVNARLDAMDTRFDAMDTKFDALGKRVGIQGRYVFLVLAVIAALGLYNATVPLLLGKGPQPTGPSQPAPATATMTDARPAELPSSAAPDGYPHGRTRTGVPAVADR